MTILKVIVIADDLTGANDTGVQFTHVGLNTVVFMDGPPNNFELLSAPDVCVFNTETRSLTPTQAYKRMKNFGLNLYKNENAINYKKIDSTLRGNIGAEIDALMDLTDFNVAIVVPSYPTNNRITIGGYHFVDHKMIADSEISKDPKFPVNESYIPSLIGEQTNRRIGYISLREIREGSINERIDSLIKHGIEIIILDAESDNDLRNISKSLLEISKKVLWVGSAGLAKSLSKELKVIRKKVIDRPLFTDVYEGDSVLVVAGSVSQITRKQVTYLVKEGFNEITLDPIELLRNNHQYLNKVLKQAELLIRNKKNIVLTTNIDTKKRSEVEKYSDIQKISNMDVANIISEKLGYLGAELIKNSQIIGAILTGGDIAFQTCKYLNVKALKIIDEVEDGVPLCQIAFSEINNIPIVTKAGAFGSKLTLVNAMKKIKELINSNVTT